MSGQVSIMIKNVTDLSGPSAFKVQVMAHNTIGELKKVLETGFPGGPVVSSQRLISTGRVLSDNLVLEHVLAKQTPPYAIHLVVVEKKTKPGNGAAVKRPPPASAAPAKVPDVSTVESSSTARTSVTPAKDGPLSVDELERSAPAPAHVAPQPEPQAGVPAADVVAPPQVPLAGQVAPANAVARNVAPQRVGFRIGFQIQWPLLFKLLFVVFLLSQNGSPRNIYFLGAIAFLIYFWQIGKLEFIVTTIAGVVRSVLNRTRARMASGDATAEPSEQPRSNSWIAYCFVFLYSFVFAFFFSLFPTWRPQVMLPLPPSRTPPGAEEETDQDELPPVEEEEEHPHID
ncbi:hypothetical protein NDN08_000076 [Rhodosorus marinus]|uniref:Ubiquitin-like domain-containing protein n=1 Tax=Rhodosorus marinus TaxID=101924 RepID=A0AAV8UE53_9RHOD|nr:hypothetical protein NDN08_000076 [Rhodosorus marinus]